MRAPFTLREPSEDTPILVEVPHAGLVLDAEAAGLTRVSARSLAHDADLYVDEIFAEAPAAGATLLCAQITRHVIDLNTAPPRAVSLPAGVPQLVTRRSVSGERVTEERPPPAELARRVRTYHEPYHAALAAILERKRRRFGRAILLCAHSFPPHGAGPEALASPADVVIGSRGRTSANARYVEAIAEVARGHGYATAHDEPFAGGYTVERHGRPAREIHAIQLEMARSLYLDPATLARDPRGMARAAAWARATVAQLLCA